MNQELIDKSLSLILENFYLALVATEKGLTGLTGLNYQQKVRVHVCSVTWSHVQLFVAPWAVVCQSPHGIF